MTPKAVYRLTLLAALTVALSDIVPAWRGYAWLFLIASALVYVVSCWAFPFRKCRTCKGMGRHIGGFGGIRLCTRCGGDGLKLRAGRRFYNAARRHRDRIR